MTLHHIFHRLSFLWHRQYSHRFRWHREPVRSVKSWPRGRAPGLPIQKVMIFGDWTTDMAWGFQELGRKTVLINMWSLTEFKQLLQQEKPDLLVTLGSPTFFSASVLACIAQRPVPGMAYVHWDTDGITWKKIELDLIARAKPDKVFTVCPEMLALLQDYGVPAEMMLYAISPQVHHPCPVEPAYKDQITFIGGAYTTVLKKFPAHYRFKSMRVLFGPLLQQGRRLDFYGDDRANRYEEVLMTLFGRKPPAGWVHPHCRYEETRRIYSGSFINLVTQNHEHTITKRTFEIMACGGFVLSYNNAAVRALFTPGHDLEVTSSPAQTLERIAFYEKNPEAYEKIRRNALISSQKHTYRQRAETILARLGG